MNAIGQKIRNDADLAHATRTRRRFARARWAQFLRGVGEAIAIVLLFIALGSLARVVMSSQVAAGSGSVTSSAVAEPWGEGR